MEGIASLEAKREFRAPRMSPNTANQSTLISSSVNSPEHQTLEASVSEIMNSGASIADSKNCGRGPPPNSYVSCSNYSTIIVKTLFIVGSLTLSHFLTYSFLLSLD